MISRETFSRSGCATILCHFHREKKPSLRIWPNGQFYCHGCHVRGDLNEHPQLERHYLMLKGPDPRQLCFPWG